MKVSVRRTGSEEKESNAVDSCARNERWLVQAVWAEPEVT